MRRIATLTLAAVIATLGNPLSAPASDPASDVVRTPVSFSVGNFDGQALNAEGGLFRSAGDTACTSSVVLLIHGLSYGEYAWDFPVEPDTYSVARALARAGYPAVAVDLPGYGASSKPDRSNGDVFGGYGLTVESYAIMVSNIVDALRQGTYGEGPAFSSIGLMGHSAGTEITELALGLGIVQAEAYIPTAYTHVPSARIAQDFFTGDYLRAAADDYEYFGGTVQGRTEYMYAPPPSSLVDPDIVAADNALAGLTPSGEIYSIGPQPSKFVMGNIKAPTLLVLAEKDLLFPSEYAQVELALFTGAVRKSLYVVPGAGHSFMLHRNAPQTMEKVIEFLRDGVLPAC